MDSDFYTNANYNLKGKKVEEALFLLQDAENLSLHLI